MKDDKDLIDDISRMTNGPFPDDYSDRCRLVGERFRAAIERHGIKLDPDDDSSLCELERGAHYIWSRSNMMYRLKVPALEIWAIVKSTLEGKP